MNILFISTLYPAYEGYSVQEITYASYNSQKNGINVIKPCI